MEAEEREVRGGAGLRVAVHVAAIAVVIAHVLLPSTLSIPVPVMPSAETSPQHIIVRSQSLLYPQQWGRQIDLSGAISTKEVFWLNLEEGYFACQVNASEKYLKLFHVSRLCDSVRDCFGGSDELSSVLGCSRDCSPACAAAGRCLRTDDAGPRCHCNDGFGGDDCAARDNNECRLRPCSVYADCTNTVGSFRCTCRPGFEGDGLECVPSAAHNQTVIQEENVIAGDVMGRPPSGPEGLPPGQRPDQPHSNASDALNATLVKAANPVPMQVESAEPSEERDPVSQEPARPKEDAAESRDPGETASAEAASGDHVAAHNSPDVSAASAKNATAAAGIKPDVAASPTDSAQSPEDGASNSSEGTPAANGAGGQNGQQSSSTEVTSTAHPDESSKATTMDDDRIVFPTEKPAAVPGWPTESAGSGQKEEEAPPNGSDGVVGQVPPGAGHSESADSDNKNQTDVAGVGKQGEQLQPEVPPKEGAEPNPSTPPRADEDPDNPATSPATHEGTSQQKDKSAGEKSKDETTEPAGDVSGLHSTNLNGDQIPSPSSAGDSDEEANVLDNVSWTESSNSTQSGAISSTDDQAKNNSSVGGNGKDNTVPSQTQTAPKDEKPLLKAEEKPFGDASANDTDVSKPTEQTLLDVVISTVKDIVGQATFEPEKSNNKTQEQAQGPALPTEQQKQPEQTTTTTSSTSTTSTTTTASPGGIATVVPSDVAPVNETHTINVVDKIKDIVDKLSEVTATVPEVKESDTPIDENGETSDDSASSTLTSIQTPLGPTESLSPSGSASSSPSLASSSATVSSTSVIDSVPATASSSSSPSVPSPSISTTQPSTSTSNFISPTKTMSEETVLSGEATAAEDDLIMSTLQLPEMRVEGTRLPFPSATSASIAWKVGSDSDSNASAATITDTDLTWPERITATISWVFTTPSPSSTGAPTSTVLTPPSSQPENAASSALPSPSQSATSTSTTNLASEIPASSASASHSFPSNATMQPASPIIPSTSNEVPISASTSPPTSEETPASTTSAPTTTTTTSAPTEAEEDESSMATTAPPSSREPPTVVPPESPSAAGGAAQTDRPHSTGTMHAFDGQSADPGSGHAPADSGPEDAHTTQKQEVTQGQTSTTHKPTTPQEIFTIPDQVPADRVIPEHRTEPVSETATTTQKSAEPSTESAQTQAPTTSQSTTSSGSVKPENRPEHSTEAATSSEPVIVQSTTGPPTTTSERTSEQQRPGSETTTQLNLVSTKDSDGSTPNATDSPQPESSTRPSSTASVYNVDLDNVLGPADRAILSSLTKALSPCSTEFAACALDERGCRKTFNDCAERRIRTRPQEEDRITFPDMTSEQETLDLLLPSLSDCQVEFKSCKDAQDACSEQLGRCYVKQINELRQKGKEQSDQKNTQPEKGESNQEESNKEKGSEQSGNEEHRPTESEQADLSSIAGKEPHDKEQGHHAEDKNNENQNQQVDNHQQEDKPEQHADDGQPPKQTDHQQVDNHKQEDKPEQHADDKQPPKQIDQQGTDQAKPMDHHQGANDPSQSINHRQATEQSTEQMGHQQGVGQSTEKNNHHQETEQSTEQIGHQQGVGQSTEKTDHQQGIEQSTEQIGHQQGVDQSTEKTDHHQGNEQIGHQQGVDQSTEQTDHHQGTDQTTDNNGHQHEVDQSTEHTDHHLGTVQTTEQVDTQQGAEKPNEQGTDQPTQKEDNQSSQQMDHEKSTNKHPIPQHTQLNDQQPQDKRPQQSNPQFADQPAQTDQQRPAENKHSDPDKEMKLGEHSESKTHGAQGESKQSNTKEEGNDESKTQPADVKDGESAQASSSNNANEQNIEAESAGLPNQGDHTNAHPSSQPNSGNQNQSTDHHSVSTTEDNKPESSGHQPEAVDQKPKRPTPTHESGKPEGSQSHNTAPEGLGPAGEQPVSHVPEGNNQPSAEQPEAETTESEKQQEHSTKPKEAQSNESKDQEQNSQPDSIHNREPNEENNQANMHSDSKTNESPDQNAEEDKDPQKNKTPDGEGERPEERTKVEQDEASQHEHETSTTSTLKPDSTSISSPHDQSIIESIDLSDLLPDISLMDRVTLAHLETILKPCSQVFFACKSAEDSCRQQFDKCAVDALRTSTVVSNFALPAASLASGESTDLSDSLLKCILAHQKCIVPNERECMATFQRCYLRAIEDWRREQATTTTQSTVHDFTPPSTTSTTPSTTSTIPSTTSTTQSTTSTTLSTTSTTPSTTSTTLSTTSTTPSTTSTTSSTTSTTPSTSTTPQSTTEPLAGREEEESHTTSATTSTASAATTAAAPSTTTTEPTTTSPSTTTETTTPTPTTTSSTTSTTTAPSTTTTTVSSTPTPTTTSSTKPSTTATTTAPPTPTPTTTPSKANRGDGLSEFLLNHSLSRNFTNCIRSYTECSNAAAAEERDSTPCREEFSACSLSILIDSRLNETDLYQELLRDSQAFVSAESSAAATEEGHQLARQLYTCIRAFMLCQASERKVDCMATYQKCSLTAMDDARRKVAEAAVEPKEAVGDDEAGIVPAVPQPGIIAKTNRVPSSQSKQSDTGPELSDSVPEACKGLKAPSGFGSFNGKPAQNMADCAWDFFSCTEHIGTWPSNKECCEQRSSACTKAIGDSKHQPAGAEATQTQTQETTTQGHAPQMDCIWLYMGCAKEGVRSDDDCKADFGNCSVSSMGLPASQQRPTEGSESSTQAETDLALNHPEGAGSNEFIACLLRLYKCEEEGELATCSNVEMCQSSLSTTTTTTTAASVVTTTQQVATEESNTDDAAEIHPGTVPPPFQPPPSEQSQDACLDSYFSCLNSRSGQECRGAFRSCAGGANPDNTICAEAAANPQNYLVAHPSDCTRFFSCQRLGVTPRAGFIAHPMNCPPTTAFDVRLRICNFIAAVPSCKNEQKGATARSVSQFSHVRAGNSRLQSVSSPQLLVSHPEPHAQVSYLTLSESQVDESPAFRQGRSNGANDAHRGSVLATCAVAAVILLVF